LAAAKWARTDELAADDWTIEDTFDVVTQLVGLARNAVSAGQNLYCWVRL
jgi:beta-lactamase class D